MLKKSLFLKIILIFTLPALGILYFSTKLVLEKLEFTDGINRTIDNANYLDYSSALVHSIQKERGFSIVFLESNKFFDKLLEQRKETNKRFNEYIRYSKVFLKKDVLNSSIEVLIKEIQNNFYMFQDLRKKVDEKEIQSKELLNYYTRFNKKILNTVSSVKTVKSAYSFNNEFINMYHFLTYKEQLALQRALVSIVAINKKLDDEILDRLKKVKILEETNINHFTRNSSLKFQEIYNLNISYEVDRNVNKILSLVLNNKIENKQIDLKFWWDESTKKVDFLNDSFIKMLIELKSLAKDISKNAFIEQNLSVFYLFITFVTLISLLFILKTIIFNKEKSFENVAKQKKVYELLNETNKQLFKKTSKEELYTKIHSIISKNQSMVFSFIYDLEEENENKKIYAQEGLFKKLLLNGFNDDNRPKETLLTRCIDWKTNILIEDFTKKNVSVFSEKNKKFGIKSAAAFPIKKFDEIVSVLFIYSNELKYFDFEVEVLFDQLTLDITHALEKFDYEATRREQEKQLKIASVAFESTDPMLITDENVQIIDVNPAFCEVMGYEKDQLIGRNPRIFKSNHQNKEFYKKMWQRIKEEDAWFGEIYNVKGSNDILPVRLTITVIRNEKNEIINYLGQYIDISDIKDRQQVLEYQATHDNLTALPNRLLLLDRIEHAITKVVRHKIIGGLIFIDLDNFKTINDSMGHDVGDILLIEVAKKLKSVVRDEDTVSRIGGDEFIVLADNIGKDNDEARKNIDILAKKIKDSLNDIKYISGYRNISTPSIGVTLFSDSSVSVKDIIKQADTAMYAAKKQGKNAIEFFN